MVSKAWILVTRSTDGPTSICAVLSSVKGKRELGLAQDSPESRVRSILGCSACLGSSCMLLHFCTVYENLQTTYMSLKLEGSDAFLPLCGTLF